MEHRPEKYVFIDKNLGETPLEALERYRADQIAAGHIELAGVPMTYAGRLDPMASGQLLILVGDECKERERYLNLDKEYEVEIVFGISTDSYDALGLVERGVHSRHFSKMTTNVVISKDRLQRYVGRFTQEYPPYSSKTVGGKQLHELARAGELPDEMPTKAVEIYEIEKLGERQISAEDLLREIREMIAKVKGDFRQAEIISRWRRTLPKTEVDFEAVSMRVKCSSGTYMRSLANRIGKDAGVGAFALSIKRTKIYSNV